MKRILALFICLLAIDTVLLFAVFVQKMREKQEQVMRQLGSTMVADLSTSVARQNATPTPTPNWPTEAAYYYQTATADPSVPISWTLEIIQNEQVIPERDGFYSLKKAPFTFRFKIPRLAFDQPKFFMLINTLNRPDNYEKVQHGTIDSPYCFQKPELADCVTFSGGAEPQHSDQWLRIDYVNGAGSNLIYYTSPDDTRWDSVEVRDQQVILDRYVFKINLQHKENELDIPSVEAFPENRLYLLFVMNYRAGRMITEDELKKAVIVFE